MMQMCLDFSKVLTDADGDKIVVHYMADTIKEIANFLKCSKKKARQVFETLKNEYDVYSNNCQIILAQGDKVLYNFEMYGQTYWQGHKYNTVNEIDFRNFIERKKVRTKKKKTVAKSIKTTCTEIQLKRSAQLYYAHTIGFNIGYEDYKKFHLMP